MSELSAATMDALKLALQQKDERLAAKTANDKAIIDLQAATEAQKVSQELVSNKTAQAEVSRQAAAASVLADLALGV